MRKTTKTLLLVTALFTGTFIFAQSSINGNSFEQSVAMIYNGYIKTTNNQSAQSFIFKNYNERGYKLKSNYAINGVDFTDDGKYNDLKAGDGTYTSVKSVPTSSVEQPDTAKVIISDAFKYKKELQDDSTTGKFGIGISCKVRITYEGTTILGFSCESGCIELYDCEVTVGWNS